MCHVILLMPLLALPVFWLLPIGEAAPTYGVVAVLSAWLYYYVLKAMHRPVEIGREHLRGAVGEVVAVRGGGHFRVHVESEFWSAESRQALQVGEQVEITDVEGVVLKVRRPHGDPPRQQPV
ncbi:MAG TPA: NfeD family protein [Gammaproteobacteria bacterium]|nr:NfeD family protein [Gammaproteobacteria bacterium]